MTEYLYKDDNSRWARCNPPAMSRDAAALTSTNMRKARSGGETTAVLMVRDGVAIGCPASSVSFHVDGKIVHGAQALSAARIK